jgi:uncharacterized NAD(P)/FAD-binding protein YdhS
LIADQMERIAFGPPAKQCSRILTLIDAGLLDLTFLNGGTVLRKARGRRWIVRPRSHEHQQIDLVINAVLPRSSQTDHRGPLRMLSRTGVLAPHSSGCGYRVDRTGRPINVRGETVEGLALLGRPTEGCILGNDTLSRQLHDHPTRWAKAVAARVRTVTGYVA